MSRASDNLALRLWTVIDQSDAQTVARLHAALDDYAAKYPRSWEGLMRAPFTRKLLTAMRAAQPEAVRK